MSVTYEMLKKDEQVSAALTTPSRAPKQKSSASAKKLSYACASTSTSNLQ
jgi:hypothetical protein